MQDSANRLRIAGVGAIASLCFLNPVEAAAETRFSVDVSASAGVATNPYLEYEVVEPDTTVISGTISITPSISIRDEAGTIRFAGNFQHVEYDRLYSSTESYDLSVNLDRRLSERLSVRAAAGYNSSVVNPSQVLVSPIGGDVGGDPGVPPQVGDITLNGQRERRQLFRESAGLAFQASANDSFTLDHSGSFTRYPSASTLQEYDSLSETVGYSRRLSEHTSIGASIGYTDTNYLDAVVSDGTVISPQLNATTRINENWSLSGSVGASITRINTIVGKLDETSFAGSFNACRRDSRTNFCLSGARSVMPTSLGGLRTQSSVATNFGYKIDDRSDINAGASYAWASRSALAAANEVEYFSANITLNTRLTERITGFVSDSYADSYEQNGLARRANIQANAGVRVALGDRR